MSEINEQDLWNQTWEANKADRTSLQKQIKHQNDEAWSKTATFSDYILDVPRGIGEGVEGFSNSIGKLANDFSGSVFGKKFADDDAFETPDRTKTWVGGLVSGITQFATGFIPVAGIAGRIGKAYQLGKAGRYALTAGAGALTDFTAFTGDDGRLTDLMSRFPVLKPLTFDFLTSKADDGWAEKRFKNSVEGLGLGFVGDLFLKGLKAYRAGKAGDTAAVETLTKEIEQDAAKVEPEVQRMFFGDDAPTGKPALIPEPELIPSGPPAGTGMPKPFELRPGVLGKNELAFADEKATKTVIDDLAYRLTGKKGVEKIEETIFTREQAADALKVDDVQPLIDAGVIREADGKFTLNPDALRTPGKFDLPVDFVAKTEKPGRYLELQSVGPQSLFPRKGKLPGEPGYAAANARPSVKKPVGDDVVKEISATFKARLGEGKGLEDALDDAVKTHVNFDRLDVHSDISTIIEGMNRELDDTIQKGVGGVESLQSLKDAAREEFQLRGGTDAQADTFINTLTKDGKALSKIRTRFIAAKILRNNMAADISSLSALAKDGSAEALGKLEQRLGAFLNLHYNVQVIQTEGARFPSSGRIITGVEKIDPDKMAKAIKSSMGSDSVDAKRFIAQLAMADGDAKALTGILAPFELAGSKAFAKALSLHNEYWMNSILSGFKTSGTNVLTNMAQSFLMPLERIVGGALTGDASTMMRGFRLYGNLVSSVFDVFRIVDGGLKLNPDSSLGYAAKSLLKETPYLDHAVTAAGEKATPLKAWSSANLGLDKGSPIGMLIDGLGSVIRLPMRTLTAADEFFKQINYRASLRDLAFQEAEKLGILAGKDPEKFARFVDDYMAQGFGRFGEATNEVALNYAQRATFTQDLLEGTWGKTIQNAIQSHPSGRLLLPFVRTPTNIMRTFWQYTPGLNLLQQEFRQALLHSADPAVRRDALGRMMIGASFAYVGVNMALTGKITGGGPSNKDERDALLATGWRPYSFRVKNEDGSTTYIEYRRIDPVASLWGIAADIAEATHGMTEFDTTAVMQAMGMSIAKNITSRTYLQGIAEAANLLSDPDRNAAKWLQQRVGSYIPNAVNQSNDDPNLREVRGLVDAIKSRLPGYSEELAPRRNFLGEITPKAMGWAPWDSDGDFKLSPFSYSTSVGDKTKDEIANLHASFSKPEKMLGPVDLTTVKKDGDKYHAYDRYQELVGEVKVKGKTVAQTLDKLVNSQWYQSQPAPTQPRDTTNARVRAVQTVLADYREAARKQLLKEYPEVNQTIRSLAHARRLQQNPTVNRILNF